MRIQLPRPAIKACEVGFCTRAGHIPCRLQPTATQLISLGQLTSTDVVSVKGKTKVSWLISIHSLIRQCFNILIRLCNPSRIRNIKIERSKQLYHNNTFFVFPFAETRSMMWRQLTERMHKQAKNYPIITLQLHTFHQGRNFGLKIGGTNSEGERGALGSQGEREGEWGGSIPSSSDSGVWESVVSSLSGHFGTRTVRH